MARSIHLSECDFARILYLYHVMFTFKNSSNYHGGVGVVDITLATRKTNTRCRKRKKDRRSKKNKSRRDEKAIRENIGENRNGKERRNYQAHRTSKTSCQRKKKPNEGTNSTSNPTKIRVSTFGKSLRINPFKIPDKPLETGRAWQEWLEGFEEDREYFEIKAVKDKVRAFKIYGWQEIKKVARNLPDTVSAEGDNDFKKLILKLNNHFLLNKNKQHTRYTFSKQQQEPGESIVSYTARLRAKAKDCEFGDQTNDRILEQLIQTIKDNDLIKKSIQKR